MERTSSTINCAKHQNRHKKTRWSKQTGSTNKEEHHSIRKRARKNPAGIDDNFVEAANCGVQVDFDVLPVDFPFSTRNQIVDDDMPTTQILANNNSARIRVVKPYPFTFSTFAKARWVGKSILDIYHEEFGSYPRTYYESAIKQGRILVSGSRVSCDYKIKTTDKLSHTVHRHEPAVSICNYNHRDGVRCLPFIKVLYEDEKIIVVDKPSTLPIHPCGGYYFNSLFHILTVQDPSLDGKLYNVHRLDRLTSGLTLIAKSTSIASKLSECIASRENCHKLYIARVRGRFPMNAPKHIHYSDAGKKNVGAPCVHGEIVINYRDEQMFDSSYEHAEAAIMYWCSDGLGRLVHDATLTSIFESRYEPSFLHTMHTIALSSTVDCKGPSDDHDNYNEKANVLWLHLACPCDVVDPKNGICKAGSGKPAQTAFTVLRYDEASDSTLVLAKPVTGRTHQIRLHLQFLGHPIANDPNYGGDMWYSNSVGAKLCAMAREEMHSLDEDSHNTAEKQGDALTIDVPASEEEIASLTNFQQLDGESLTEFIERSCVWCARSRGGDRPILEYLVRSPGIWLHAYSYSLMFPDVGLRSFSAELPSWYHF